jgi:hypothetical protein
LGYARRPVLSQIISGCRQDPAAFEKSKPQKPLAAPEKMFQGCFRGLFGPHILKWTGGPWLKKAGS